MRATTVMGAAIGIFVVGKWAHDKPAVTLKTVASAVFLILVIGFMDQGKTAEIAKGLAWLILASAILSNDSPVTPVATLISTQLSNAPFMPGGGRSGAQQNVPSQHP